MIWVYIAAGTLIWLALALGFLAVNHDVAQAGRRYDQVMADRFADRHHRDNDNPEASDE